MTGTPTDLGRPATGDVVDLILDDHRRFEALLRQVRDDSADRDGARLALAALHVAHAEAEERHVYPTLRADHAIGAHESEHGEQEHAEGHRVLLAVLELEELTGAKFDEAVEELCRVLNHHLVEEELTILNPTRRRVPQEVRVSLGEVFARERNAQLEDGCGGVEQVRALVAQADRKGLLGHGI